MSLDQEGGSNIVATLLGELARRTADHLRAASFSDPEDSSLAQRFSNDIEALDVVDLPTARRDGRETRGLRFAPVALAAVPPKIGLLGEAARTAFGLVNWTEFYAEDDWSRPFLDRFANGEGIGPDGTLVCDRVILGLFVLGPGAYYPPHAHPAEEFYLVLSGTPAFQVGANSAFLSRPPGSVILHHSNQSHAIRTGDDPFFAVFGWRGDIASPSWYRDDMGDPEGPVRYPTIRKD